MSACCRSLFFTLCALPAALAWAQPGESIVLAGRAPSEDGDAAAPLAATPPRSALWQSIEAQRRQPRLAGPWPVRRLNQDERALMRAQIRDYHGDRGVRASAVSAAAVAPGGASAHPPSPVAR